MKNISGDSASFNLPLSNNPGAVLTGNFTEKIRSEYASLTPQMKIAARYILDSPYEFALNSLGSIASLIDISQSTLVRLAKHFGFKNGQDFQKRIREDLLKTGDYSFRVRYSGEEEKEKQTGEETFTHGVMRNIIHRNKDSLDALENSIDPKNIENIACILADAKTIFLGGVRRILPLLFAMRYGLSHFHKNVHIIGGMGGMFREEAENISGDSLLFTVSYHPYSPEPIDVQNIAIQRGAKNILMTDCDQHPLFNQMDEVLLVRDAELYGLRTLSASHTLIQTLALSVGMKLSKNPDK